MFWADKIATQLKKSSKPQLVDDAKTPSGRIHVGALRGVIIHDLVHKALQNEGVPSRYTYIIDDQDPMDSLPVYLPKEKYDQFMGVPLKNIPAPTFEDEKVIRQGPTLNSDEGRTFKANSYAEYYAYEFIEVFNRLGANPEIIWASDLYIKHTIDKYLKLALDNAEKIQKIYEKVSGSARPKDFIPFQPICESCGKIGTTVANKWDGEFVYYDCVSDKVEWAKGCGHSGKVSPFGGTGKLPWRVEWPAKWAALGVTVEGEGKDHASKGGSRDTANAIAREIFDYEPPYDIPYEHFLLGGKKMSSSKGVGFSAAEVGEILPSEILRFLMVRPRPMQHIEFDPELEHTIPKLFDDFDIARQSPGGDLKRIYEFSAVDAPKSYFVPRFRDLVNLLQITQYDSDRLVKKAEELKGSKLSEEDKQALEDRVKYVKIYLEAFAPENIKFSVKESLPLETENLSDNQKKLLKEITGKLSEDTDPEKLQNDIYQLGKELGLSSAEAFEAIYASLLGKRFGPKAAWLVLSLDKEFVKKRFEEVAK